MPLPRRPDAVDKNNTVFEMEQKATSRELYLITLNTVSNFWATLNRICKKPKVISFLVGCLY